eukprot:945051-Prymnesium_polylepis.1
MMRPRPRPAARTSPFPHNICTSCARSRQATLCASHGLCTRTRARRARARESYINLSMTTSRTPPLQLLAHEPGGARAHTRRT